MMSNATETGYTITLPRKHAWDWQSRFDGDADAPDGYGVTVEKVTARTITLSLTNAALADLISDAHYYAEEMDRDNTGDIDYRPAARRCIAGIERAGINYTRRGFSVTLEGAN